MNEQARSVQVAIEKSVGKLLDKADDCFERAKADHALAENQHQAAETQHDVADKVDASADSLEALGQALVDDAVELKGEIEFGAARGSHVSPGGTPGIPLKAGELVRPKNS